MPGFMGLRGLEQKKSPLDIERERRRDQEQRHNASHGEKERPSREKVQEILQDQEGDMSAFNQVLSGETKPGEDVAALPVEKIMSGRVAVLSFDDTLLTAQGIFHNVRFHHLPVVDDNGCLIGIVSDRDVLRLCSPFFGTINEQKRDTEVMSRKVGTFMTRNPLTVTLGTKVEEAIRVMGRKKIGCLPVMEKDTSRLMGIVTWKDIVRAYCPRAFVANAESSRLKTGVHINPEAAESARLRTRAAESARLRAETGRYGPVAGGAAASQRSAAPQPAAPSGPTTKPPTPEPKEQRPGAATTALHPKVLEGRLGAAGEMPPFDPERSDVPPAEPGPASTRGSRLPPRPDGK